MKSNLFSFISKAKPNFETESEWYSFFGFVQIFEKKSFKIVLSLWISPLSAKEKKEAKQNQANSMVRKTKLRFHPV